MTGTLNKAYVWTGPVCFLRKQPLTLKATSHIEFVMLVPGKHRTDPFEQPEPCWTFQHHRGVSLYGAKIEIFFLTDKAITVRRS